MAEIDIFLQQPQMKCNLMNKLVLRQIDDIQLLTKLSKIKLNFSPKNLTK